MNRLLRALVLATVAIQFVGCGGGADAPPAESPKPVSPSVAQIQANRQALGRPPGVDPDDDVPVAPPKPAGVQPKAPARAPGAEPDDAPAPSVAASPAVAKRAAGARPAPPPGAEADEAPPAEVPLITSARVKELQNAMAPDELPVSSGVAAAAAKLEFPTDFAQWTADDFRLARKKRERRLVQAVRQLGSGNKLNPDADANARLLGELLKAPESSAPSAGAAKLAGADDSELPVAAQSGAMLGLAQAIVETLGINSGVEARAVLKQILLGTQPSDADDRTLTSLALRVLVNHPDEENRRILAAVLTVPDSIRPAGRGQVTADQLQDECLKLVRPIASADFRLLVAQRAARSASSAASRRRLMAFLLAAEPANIGAQVELIVGGQVEQGLLPAIDRQLGQTSQQALDRLLNASPTELAGSNDSSYVAPAGVEEGRAREMTIGDAIQLAEQLWRRDFSQALATRLEASADGAADLPLLTLAANLPTDTARAAIARRLEKTWVEDFTAAENSVPISGATGDPGLLLVLKQLPREAPSAKPLAKSAHETEVAAQRSRTRPNGQPENAQAQRVASENLAKHAALVASENFIRFLDQRLARAAQSQSIAATVASGAVAKPVSSIDEFNSLLKATDQAKPQAAAAKNPPDDALPSELRLSNPPSARVELAYRLNWPADLHNEQLVAATGPLVVYFQRIQCTGDANSVAAFYQRQLNQTFLRTIDNGRWVDALAKLDNGRVRSVDVMITRLESGAQPDRAIPQRSAVDLLVIEAPDPLQPPINR